MNNKVIGSNSSELSDIFSKFAKYLSALILNSFSGLISTDKKGSTVIIENISAKPDIDMKISNKKTCPFLFRENLYQSLFETLKTSIDWSISD